MEYQSIVFALDAEIARLTQIRTLLGKSSKTDKIVKSLEKVAGRKKPGKRKLSPEARARIAEAQRKRWAAVKRGSK